MKKFSLIIMLLATVTMSAQGIMEATYLDVPASKIGRFAQLHKTITDMSMGEERTLQDQWVYRHWYGSGHSIVIYDLYASPEDAVKDDAFAVLGKNYEALSDEEKKEKVLDWLWSPEEKRTVLGLLKCNIWHKRTSCKTLQCKITSFTNSTNKQIPMVPN